MSAGALNDAIGVKINEADFKATMKTLKNYADRREYRRNMKLAGTFAMRPLAKAFNTYAPRNTSDNADKARSSKKYPVPRRPLDEAFGVKSAVRFDGEGKAGLARAYARVKNPWRAYHSAMAFLGTRARRTKSGENRGSGMDQSWRINNVMNSAESQVMPRFIKKLRERFF